LSHTNCRIAKPSSGSRSHSVRAVDSSAELARWTAHDQTNRAVCVRSRNESALWQLRVCPSVRPLTRRLSCSRIGFVWIERSSCGLCVATRGGDAQASEPPHSVRYPSTRWPLGARRIGEHAPRGDRQASRLPKPVSGGQVGGWPKPTLGGRDWRSQQMSTLDPHVRRGTEVRGGADVIHDEAVNCVRPERVMSWGLGT